MKLSPLSIDEQKHLLKIYAYYTNSELAETFGVQVKTITNFAYKNDLHKSKEHIAKLRQRQAENTNNKRWKK